MSVPGGVPVAQPGRDPAQHLQLAWVSPPSTVGRSAVGRRRRGAGSRTRTPRGARERRLSHRAVRGLRQSGPRPPRRRTSSASRGSPRPPASTARSPPGPPVGQVDGTLAHGRPTPGSPGCRTGRRSSRSRRAAPAAEARCPAREPDRRPAPGAAARHRNGIARVTRHGVVDGEPGARRARLASGAAGPGRAGGRGPVPRPARRTAAAPSRSPRSRWASPRWYSASATASRFSSRSSLDHLRGLLLR